MQKYEITEKITLNRRFSLLISSTGDSFFLLPSSSAILSWYFSPNFPQFRSSNPSGCKCIMFPILKLLIQPSSLLSFIPRVVRDDILKRFSAYIISNSSKVWKEILSRFFSAILSLKRFFLSMSDSSHTVENSACIL
jgi:hypothetical protein